MKKLLFILLFTIVSIGYSQTSPGLTPAKKPKTVTELTKGCDSTGGLIYNGNKVWKSPKGKYFIIKFSQIYPYNPYKYYLNYRK